MEWESERQREKERERVGKVIIFQAAHHPQIGTGEMMMPKTHLIRLPPCKALERTC